MFFICLPIRATSIYPQPTARLGYHRIRGTRRKDPNETPAPGEFRFSGEVGNIQRVKRGVGKWEALWENIRQVAGHEG